MIERNYSIRSASMGLIGLARLAGNRQATRAATPRMEIVIASNGKPQATRLPLQLIRGDQEPFNRFALNESIHNLRDVRDCDAPVEKVIGFD
jgi:hypothetical protein